MNYIIYKIEYKNISANRRKHYALRYKIDKKKDSEIDDKDNRNKEGENKWA